MKLRVASVVIVLLAACRTTTADRNPYAGQPDAVQAGHKLYAEHCSQCHGAAAEGKRDAPSLRSVAKSDRELFAFLTNGDLRHGMPSWSRLTDDRRWQIITYVRSLH